MNQAVSNAKKREPDGPSVQGSWMDVLGYAALSLAAVILITLLLAVLGVDGTATKLGEINYPLFAIFAAGSIAIAGVGAALRATAQGRTERARQDYCGKLLAVVATVFAFFGAISTVIPATIDFPTSIFVFWVMVVLDLLVIGSLVVEHLARKRSRKRSVGATS